jgi:hypothetical protein
VGIEFVVFTISLTLPDHQFLHFAANIGVLV